MTAPTFTAGQPLTLTQLAYIADLEHRLAVVGERTAPTRVAHLEEELAAVRRNRETQKKKRQAAQADARRAADVAGRLRAENTRLRALLRHPHDLNEATDNEATA